MKNHTEKLHTMFHHQEPFNKEKKMDYEYIEVEWLPNGWELAVYKDEKVIVCSPGTCPEELGGYNAAIELTTAKKEYRQK